MTPTCHDRAVTARDPRAWTLYLRLGLGLLAASFLVGYAVWRAEHNHADLLCFHYTSRHWLATGQFTQEFGVRHYLPAFVVLMTPLAAWPLRMTAALMAVVNILLLLLAARTADRLIATSADSGQSHAHSWLLPIALAMPFAADTIALGQVNILVLWLCLLALQQLTSKRDALAGLAIAVAGIIKLYPLLLIVPLLLRGRYRAAGSAVISFVLLAGGFSLGAFGWSGSVEAHRKWLTEVRGGDASAVHLMFRAESNEFLRHNNQSLAAVLRRSTTTLDLGVKSPAPPLHLSLGQSKFIYAATAAGLLSILAWTTWRRRNQTICLAEWSAWMAGVIAFVPIYWTHYFVLLLPALAVLAGRAGQARAQGRPDRFAELLLAAWLIGLMLLASSPARWFGANCWPALAVSLWCLQGRLSRDSQTLGNS